MNENHIVKNQTKENGIVVAAFAFFMNKQTGAAAGKQRTLGTEVKAEQELLEEAAGWILKLETAPDGSPLFREFDAWLMASRGNRTAWESVNQTWQLLGAIRPADNQKVWGDVPSLPKPGLAPLVETMTRARSARASFVRSAGLAIAAVSVAWLIWIVAPIALIAWQADHRTGAGETEIVAMADGSTVELGGRSAISTKVDSAQRKVTLLAGEAFFDVFRDAERPFVVDAQGIELEVLGTAFDVQVSSSTTNIALLRGSVVIRSGAQDGVVTVLKPGERFAVDHDTGAVSVTAVSLDEIGAWRDGKVFLADATVASAVELIQRYHPAWISLPDGSLAARKVSGLFDLRHPDQALSALVGPFGGKVRSVSPLVRIVTRL